MAARTPATARGYSADKDALLKRLARIEGQVRGVTRMVQEVVSKREMRRLLPDDSPKTLLVASGLGAASSSCSYASVALARSLFRKGADFTAAMAFQFASTNLVIE